MPHPQLRPYQQQILRAVVRSVTRRQGLTFSVEIARQGGKNEVSARIELALLTRYATRGGTIIKAAPTLRPQARNSLRRLLDRFRDNNLADLMVVRDDSLEYLRARILFMSAARTANVVGMTADLLLEIDESQDVLPEKYSRDFRPMAATANATTVHYGTAWEETSLLETVKQANLEAERRDGVRRHFRVDWEEVGRYNPDYARYVRAERDRLGADHPLFLSQYALVPLGRAGRFFDDAQLAQLQGSHRVRLRPRDGDTYVAGVDLAGEASGAPPVVGRRDAVVVTVAAVEPVTVGSIGAPLPRVRVVRWYAWTGEPHARLLGTLADLLGRVWRCRRIAVDATGLGEPVAAFLATALGASRVRRVVFTGRNKSDLGYGLLAAVNGGRVVVPADTEPIFWEQCRLARRSLRPNQTLNFFVDPADGHDDYLMSLALAVHAAGSAGPRTAVGRTAAQDAVDEDVGREGKDDRW